MKKLNSYFKLGLILLVLHGSSSVNAKQITLYQMLDSSDVQYDAGNFLKSIDWANKAIAIAENLSDIFLKFPMTMKHIAFYILKAEREGRSYFWS